MQILYKLLNLFEPQIPKNGNNTTCHYEDEIKKHKMLA